MLGKEQEKVIFDTIMNRIPATIPEELVAKTAPHGVEAMRGAKIVKYEGMMIEEDIQELKRFIEQSDAYEVEVAFGFYGESGNFVPTLFSVSQFNKLLSFFKGVVLNEDPNFRCEHIETKDIVEIQYYKSQQQRQNKQLASEIKKTKKEDTTVSRAIRRISSLGGAEVKYQEKTRGNLRPISSKKYGYRITSSKEVDLSLDDVKEMFGEKEGVVDFHPVIARKRHRHTFHFTVPEFARSGIKFDLTTVIETRYSKGAEIRENTTYEVEIERIVPVVHDLDELSRIMRSAIDKIVCILNYPRHIGLGPEQFFRTEATTKKNLFDIYHKAPELIMTLFERKQAVAFHEYFFEEDKRRKGVGYQNTRRLFATLSEKRKTVAYNEQKEGEKVYQNPYRLWNNYWNKPTNLKIADILENNDYAVTEKLDGLRTFVLITRNGVYMCNPPSDIYKLAMGGGNLQSLEGTLVDCEFYKKEFHVFDILFYKFQDLRFKEFKERLDILYSITLPRLAFSLSFVVKRFEISDGDSFYTKTQKIFEKIERNNLVTDGIIYQSLGPYKNTKTRKWKSMELMTIDFFLQKVEDERDMYWLLVKSDKENGSVYTGFLGTKKHPFDGKIIIPEGRFQDEDVDRKVVECKWNYQQNIFEIIKFRFDKPCNSFKVAVDVWKDIVRPVFKGTILGQTTQVARGYHNRIKSELLNRYYKRGTEIVDIGSGRGGDLSKWKTLNPRRVFVFEPNRDNYEIFEQRKETLGLQFPIEHMVSEETGTYLGIDDADEIRRILEERKTKISTVCAFFSLSFVSYEGKIESVIESISNFLEPDGHFICIFMNGLKVMQLLNEERNKEGIPRDESSSIENDCFYIGQLNEFRRGHPHKIEITVNDPDSMVKDQKEYLTFQLDLQYLASMNGLEYLTSFDLDHGNYFLSLSEQAKDYSKLFTSIIFRKLSPTKVFNTTVLTTNDDQEIENFSISAFLLGPSNIFYSVLRAYFTDFLEKGDEEQFKLVSECRQNIRKEIEKDNALFENMEGGLVAKFYEEKAKNQGKGESGLELFLWELTENDIPIRFKGIFGILSKIFKCNIYILSHGILENCGQSRVFDGSIIVVRIDKINYSTVIRRNTKKDQDEGIFNKSVMGQLRRVFCPTNIPKEIVKSNKEKSRLDEITTSMESLQMGLQEGIRHKREFFLPRPPTQILQGKIKIQDEEEEAEVHPKFLQLLRETERRDKTKVVSLKQQSSSKPKKSESLSSKTKEKPSTSGSVSPKTKERLGTRTSISPKKVSIPKKQKEEQKNPDKSAKGKTPIGKRIVLKKKKQVTFDCDTSPLEKILDEVKKKHKLSAIEYGTFKAYVFNHILIDDPQEEDETRRKFLCRLLEEDREYLEQFTTGELERIGESIYSRKRDRMTMRERDDVDQLYDLYVKTIERLREIPSTQRMEIYKSIFKFALIQDEDKNERRERFYLAFRKYVDGLTQGSFENYLEDVETDSWVTNLENYK
jgi:hypothetical protein